jgi:AraC-like DNA-binding protein
MRHRISTALDPKRGVAIATLAEGYCAGSEISTHAHRSDQLIYATHGIMEITAANRIWLTPPHLAVWIPSGTLHRKRMKGAVSMRTLYLRRGLALPPPAHVGCRVLYVSPLLRELIIESVHIGQLRSGNRLQCALRDLVVSQLQAATTFPMFVTMPTDPRALRVAKPFIEDPAESRTLRVRCKEAGVGVRTLERVFEKNVGISFGAWRRQVRLMKAIELLVEGRSVKEASARVGYQQPSAFVEMFRRSLGTTPRAWSFGLRNHS